MKKKFTAFLMSFLMCFSMIGTSPITLVYAEEPTETPTQETTVTAEGETIIDADVVYQEDLDAYGLVFDEVNSQVFNRAVYTDGSDYFIFAHSGNAPNAWYVYFEGAWYYVGASTVSTETPAPTTTSETTGTSEKGTANANGEVLEQLDNGEYVLTADDFSDATTNNGISMFTLFAANEAKATITELKYVGVYDGTAPFDDNSNAGFDESQTNGIVRSYDKVTYRTSYSTTVDQDGATVTSGTLHFEAFLPTTSDVATWDLNAMNWMQNAEVTEVAGGQSLTGEVTFNGGQLAPRIGTINWVIAVGGINPETGKGAGNGTQIPAPEFSMWLNEDAPVDAISDDEITVSSKTTIDASIQFYQTTDKKPYWGISVNLVANKVGNGIKGMELPVNGQPLTMDIALNMSMTYLDIKLNNNKQAGVEGMIPLDAVAINVPYDDGSLTLETLYNKVYDGGVVSAVGTGNTVTITLKDFKFDNILLNKVTHPYGQSKITGIVYDDDVYPFASMILLSSQPVNPGLGSNVTATITDLNAIDNFGEQVKDNDTTNNKASYVASHSSAPTGGLAFGPQIFNFSSVTASLPWERGISTTEWSTDADGKSDFTSIGKTYPNQTIEFYNMIHSGSGYVLDHKGVKKIEVFYKFNSDYFLPLNDDNKIGYSLHNDSSLISYLQNETKGFTILYVAKANGTNWTSNAEMFDAHIANENDINYKFYASATDMIASGDKCVGFYASIDNVSVLKPWDGKNTGFETIIRYPNVKSNPDALLDENGVTKNIGDQSLIAVTTSETKYTLNDNTVRFNYSTSTKQTMSSSNACGADSNTYFSYTPITLNEDGTVKTFASTSNHWYSDISVKNGFSNNAASGGQSIYFMPYTVYLNYQIEQLTNDTSKEVYNLDNNQRFVDLTISAGTVSTNQIKQLGETITVTTKIDEGQNPANDNGVTTEEKWNITYGGVAKQDDTTNGGAGVIFEGSSKDASQDKQWQDALAESGVTGASYTVTETLNVDGTTTLTWVFTNYPVSYALPDIHYQVKIGNDKDLSKDVISGTMLLNKTEVTTEYVANPISKEVGFTPIRMGGGVIQKIATPEIRTQENATIGFDVKYTDEAVLSAGNQGKVSVIDILPYEGDDYGNADMGNYTLANASLTSNLVKLSYENAPAPTLTFYYTLEEGSKVKTSVGDFLDGDTLYDFTDPMWKTTTDISSLNGQKVTAIGWVMENQGDTSTATFHYEYNWADADEAKEHQNKDVVKNRALVAGENGILQETYSEDTSRPSISKQIIGINDTMDDTGALNGEYVQVGDVLTYQINYTNPTSETAKIDIYDKVPVGTEFVSAENDGKLETDKVHWVVENVGIGEGGSVTFKVKVTEDAGKTVENQAYDIVNDDPELKYETNTIINPVLKYEAVKGSTPVNGTKVNRGDEIEYSIEIENTGENVIPFVQIKDYIPNGTTYVAGSASNNGVYVASAETVGATDIQTKNYVEYVVTNLAIGSKTTVTFKVTVDEDCELDQVENVALTQAFPKNPGEPGKIEKDPTKETNHIIHPLGTPNIVAVKSSNPVTGTTVSVGDTVKYTITITNDGDGLAKFVPVRDYIPAGTSYVKDSVSTGGAYVEKLATTTDEKSGNYVEWVLTDIKPGESKEVNFSIKVNETCALDQIENVALYEHDYKNPGEPGKLTKDPTSETNKIVHPLGEPIIEAIKSSDPVSGTTVQKGDTITYTVTIKNSGTGIAKFVQVRDVIPEGTTYVANSLTNPTKATGAYSSTGNYVEWVLTDLEVGESRDVTFKVTVNDDITLDKVTNVALYESFKKDPGKPGEITKAPTHETNKIVHPLGNPSVTVVKSSDPVTGTTVKKGQTITYYLDVTNNGTAPVNFTQVRDYIPLMTTYVDGSVSSVTGAQGAYVSTSSDGAYVEWVLDNLGVGETRTVSFKVTVNQDAINKIINEALYDWMEEDPGTPGSISNKPSIKTNQVVHPLAQAKPINTGDTTSALPYACVAGAGVLLLAIVLFLNKKKDTETPENFYK